MTNSSPKHMPSNFLPHHHHHHRFNINHNNRMSISQSLPRVCNNKCYCRRYCCCNSEKLHHNNKKQTRNNNTSSSNLIQHIVNIKAISTSNKQILNKLIVIYSLIACLHFILSTFIVVINNVNAESDCNEPLLSQSDARLLASSEFSRDRSANDARLDSSSSSSSSAWTAAQSDFAQYLIIDLGAKYNISSLSTQGRAFSSEFVTEFRVDYGFDGKDFAQYRDKNGNIKIFDANTDDRSIVSNVFDSPLVAQYLRINPTRWHNRISMRIMPFGCSYNAEVLGFDGQSIILQDLRQKPIDAYEDHIQFRLKTLQPNGSILYATSDVGDSLAIQLINNKLTYTINLGSTNEYQTVIASSLMDDNIWHDISIDRYGKNVVISVDRIVVRQTLSGDFNRLNLNLDLWIGGVPALMYYTGINTSQYNYNFTGCIENLLINGTNIASELKTNLNNNYNNNYIYQTFGYIYHFCMHQPTQTITFSTSQSHFSVEGYQLPMMNCSLNFRTFVDDGVLLYSKFSVGESILLYLRDGKLLVNVQGEFGPLVKIEPFEFSLNDGSWHLVRVILRENLITITVDDETSVTRRKFKFQSGRDYYIGGTPSNSNNQPGFVGCMRYIYIEGRYVSLSSISADRIHRTDPSDIVLDACQMIDKCHPNPCEHNGVCKQNQNGFTCQCGNTGYVGAVCHISMHPPSCESYKIENPNAKEKTTLIDVDGSGPAEPVLVTCKFSTSSSKTDNDLTQITQTIIHHQNEDETLIQGYDAKGSFVKTINYNASLASIRTIIERSNSCSQYLSYSCMNARLLNTGSKLTDSSTLDPYSWWVGNDNQRMDYWAGSLPGSGTCACGLDGSCKDPFKGCNCDALLAISSNELVDDGYITRSEHLPIRAVHVGDTGAYISNHKYAKVYVGPLICEGDSSMNDVITFKYDDAYIEFPNVILGEASDLYLQFKTTATSGVLISGKGLNETIKLSLINEKAIQFLYSNNRDAQPLTVEATYRFNDNNWHSVKIERNKKETRLVVDGQMSAHVRTRPPLVQTIPVMSQLLIGATEDFKDGFVGCMRSFLINGQAMELTKSARDGAYGLLVGCHGRCETNPCLNKGICKEGYSSYVCDCQWTAYKGPICADEIGANLRSDNYIRYDFDTSLSTVEETIKVGFTTNEHKGLIIGINSNTGDYLNLLMSTSGHLKLEFDFGFERKEEVINQENFALGQHHDLTIKRIAEGSKLVITVDNYEPLVYVYRISKNADAKFDQLKSIYIGRNETMDAGDGFVGCISHVSFDDNFPLRALFQEIKRPNVHAFPPDDSIREDTCGIEPIRPAPEKREKRPYATLRDAPSKAMTTTTYKSIKLTLAILASIALACVSVIYIRFRSREKGDYITKEDIGSKEAPDPDTAVVLGITGSLVAKKQEYFI